MRELLIKLFNADWPEEFNATAFCLPDKNATAINDMAEFYKLSEKQCYQMGMALIEENEGVLKNMDWGKKYLYPIANVIGIANSVTQGKFSKIIQLKEPNTFFRDLPGVIPESFFARLGWKELEEGFNCLVEDGELEFEELIKGGVHRPLANRIRRQVIQYKNAKDEIRRLLELDKYDEDLLNSDEDKDAD